MFKKDSLYSINKKNPDAVVYKFANGEQSLVTRADFSTEEEFLAFKAWSDEDLHTEDKRDVLAGIRQVPIDDISEAAISVPPADVVMEYQHQRAVQRRKASEMVVQLKDKLTDTQFRRLWMYHVDGKTDDERFEMTSQNYEAEQRQLEAEVVVLRQEIEVQERQNENIERFVRTADKYVDIEEIDPCMLRELIKAIYVEAPDKSSGKRRQKIHIEYDGIGFIPLDELAKKETA